MSTITTTSPTKQGDEALAEAIVQRLERLVGEISAYHSNDREVLYRRIIFGLCQVTQPEQVDAIFIAELDDFHKEKECADNTEVQP